MKKALKLIGALLAAVLLAVTALVVYLSVNEFKPEDRTPASTVFMPPDAQAFSGDTVTVMTFNTGYAGLGEDADFFMDGGKNVRATDEDGVRENLAEMTALVGETDADFVLLQEIDRDSARTYGVDQYTAYPAQTQYGAVYAVNYDCPFVPIPLPPMGKILSGIETLTACEVASAERISLPCPFSWPASAAQIKRCLLVTRTPIEGSDRELVLINLHLEAYDDGEGKIAQTNVLLSVLEEEYAKGNYVIAGGDFNQSFPGALEQWPIADPALWAPGILEDAQLPADWRFAYDASVPTCRLLDAPYDPETTQHYVIDGYILSPNVELVSVQTLDLGFVNSDHNPVLLKARLK